MEWTRNVEYQQGSLTAESGHQIFYGPTTYDGRDDSATEAQLQQAPRTGEQITLRKLRVKAVLETNNAMHPNQVKFLLVKFQGVQTAPLLSDIFEDANRPFISPWKKDSDIKYQVVMNQNIAVGTLRNGSVSSAQVSYPQGIRADIRVIEKEFKLETKVEYQSLSANAPINNLFVMWAIPYVGYSSAHAPTYRAYLTYVYTDM